MRSGAAQDRAAAYESLTAVGVYMRDIMRQMADEIEALPGPKTVH
jgi:hypothetical protein